MSRLDVKTNTDPVEDTSNENIPETTGKEAHTSNTVRARFRSFHVTSTRIVNARFAFRHKITAR